MTWTKCQGKVRGCAYKTEVPRMSFYLLPLMTEVRREAEIYVSRWRASLSLTISDDTE